MLSISRGGTVLAALALAVGTQLGFVHPSCAQSGLAQSLTPGTASRSPKIIHLSSQVLQQIAALRAEKAARTPVQKKLDSNLLRASYRVLPTTQPRTLSAATVRLLNSVAISRIAQPNSQGMVLVDIKGIVSATLLTKIQAAGGSIQGSWPNFGAIRASLPITQLQKLAADSGVFSIRPASQASLVRSRQATDMSSRPLVPGLPQAVTEPTLTAAQRQAHVQAALPALLARVRADKARAASTSTRAASTSSGIFSLTAFGGGLVNTADPEGDLAQRAALARQTFNVSGAGIKVGVLSDSVDGLAQEQRRGALGPVTVLPSQSGVPGTGEGTAMLEIVHRLAPSAQLYFASAFNGEASFAANIIALQQAGCNVIVDDVSYFDEPPFQDGIIAQAVDTVSAAGAYYFSSAGNNYNVDQEGITANWEGDFVDSGGGLLAYDMFGDNANQVLTYPGYEQQTALLFWADPQSTTYSGATDDYDLFVLDPTDGTVLFSSTDPHDGLPGEDPLQACEADQGDLIVVIKNHGNSVDLHLFLTSDGAAVLSIATPGGTYGHATAASAYGTAAADASIPYSQDRAFNSSDVTESFSSDGPRRIIFNADGSEITPGNRTSTGGVLRQKPVLASSDGISDFFTPFYGTSAAAPHAAAIAALVLSADPSLKTQPAQMFSLLTGSCIPIDNPSDPVGFDSMGNPIYGFAPLPNRDTGYGLLDAYLAVGNAAALKK